MLGEIRIHFVTPCGAGRREALGEHREAEFGGYGFAEAVLGHDGQVHLAACFERACRWLEFNFQRSRDDEAAANAVQLVALEASDCCQSSAGLR